MELDTVLDTIARAAAAWSAGDDCDAAFTEQWNQLPLELRALLAMTALAAADRHLSTNGIAKAGRFSRGNAYTKKRLTMELLAAAAPPLVEALLQPARTGPTLADLQRERQTLHETIAELRGRIAEDAERIDALATYAAELHGALKPEYEQNLRSRAQRVTDISPRLRPVPDIPDDTA